MRTHSTPQCPCPARHHRQPPARAHRAARQQRWRSQHLRIDVAVGDKLAQQPRVLVKDAVGLVGLAESLPCGPTGLAGGALATPEGSRPPQRARSGACTRAASIARSGAPWPARQTPPCGSSRSCLPRAHGRAGRLHCPPAQPAARRGPSPRRTCPRGGGALQGLSGLARRWSRARGAASRRARRRSGCWWPQVRSRRQQTFRTRTPRPIALHPDAVLNHIQNDVL